MTHTAQRRTIFISAGDVSGDIHAAHLAQALKELDPSLRIVAIGGVHLQKIADQFLTDLASQGIHGFIEPVKQLPALLKLLKQVRTIFREKRPAAFIAVDFYGLNHQFLKIAKEENIPAYYYVTPQVWATRQYRAKILAALTQKMYVIYPFEPAFHKQRGGNAVFLGNPLLDNMPAPQPKNFNSKDPKTHAWKLGLLPGSRPGEIARLTPVFYQTFKKVCKAFPNTQAYVFLLPDADEKQFLKLMGEETQPAHLHFVKETDYKIRKEMDFLLACSGTATLENALLGVPMLVAYQLFWPTYAIARMLIQVKYISLVNILADKPLVKEFIQHLSADELAAETVRLFSHPEKLQQMHRELLTLRASLGEPGVAKRAAADILQELAL